MKKHHIYQEILLNPYTTCFKKEWCEINPIHRKKISEKEKLLELIWNGMLKELLPEISMLNRKRKPLTLWDIYEIKNLLEVNLGDSSDIPLDHRSISPGAVYHYACQN